MSLLILLLLICAVAVAGALALSSSQGKSGSSQVPLAKAADSAQTFTYSCQKYLFTRAEATFYRALQEAISDQYLVFGKVRVADVLKPQTDNRGDWQKAFNKISAKHFDFVLCDSDSLKVVATVELDDSSHQRVDRVKRDDFLNQAVVSAGLPLIRFPVQAAYDPETIQRHIAESLGSAMPKPVRKARPRPK